jgi:hypothetical protein
MAMAMMYPEANNGDEGKKIFPKTSERRGGLVLIASPKPVPAI